VPGRAGARPLNRRLRALPLLVVAAALMLSACGTSAGKPSDTPTTGHPRTDDTRATRAPRTQRDRPGTLIGTSERVPAAATTLLVTVTKVIDPLTDSGAKVPVGREPVGVVVTARNAGPGGYDSSATSDFALLTAAGAATPVYAPAGVCQTYIQDFMNEIGPGQSRKGCIAYTIPRGQAPTTVRFSPDGGTTGHSVSWNVP
jgi:predicted small secreted protein